MAKVFGVIALKGGVGKTSVVANLGSAISKEYGKKVLMIDGNFSTPHLGLHFGLINPGKTLHNVLEGTARIQEAIYEHSDGFHIIPGSVSPVEINPLLLRDKIEPLKELYDYIIIDSSPSLNDEMYSVMSCSDEILVVSTPDYPTLSSTLHAIRVAKKKNAPIKGIIVNKTRGKKFELNKNDIEKASDIDVLAVLPDDINVLAGLAQMKPVVSYKPGRDVSNVYKKLAANLIGEKYKSQKIFHRVGDALRKLKRRNSNEQK
jgi:MinD-like ATPase involved in chromosome partitioning or flagellar assembly